MDIKVRIAQREFVHLELLGLMMLLPLTLLMRWRNALIVVFAQENTVSSDNIALFIHLMILQVCVSVWKASQALDAKD